MERKNLREKFSHYSFRLEGLEEMGLVKKMEEAIELVESENPESIERAIELIGFEYTKQIYCIHEYDKGPVKQYIVAKLFDKRFGEGIKNPIVFF